jgi:hypothetical protein
MQGQLRRRFHGKPAESACDKNGQGFHMSDQTSFTLISLSRAMSDGLSVRIAFVIERYNHCLVSAGQIVAENS